MDLEFSSLEELYNRLKPALRSKQRELNEYGYGYLKIEDIWNYLKESVWKNSINLSLNEMVSDILSVDNELVDAYFKEKLNEKNRVIYFE
ncbi:MAG: hypothetical protein IKJ43_01010 [Bacilli bacterium]|nr:hypothetical protein [Bacilli bacterium]